jgi:hypothetical protein
METVEKVLVMGTERDSKTGRFVRKHTLWTGENWDDGYTDHDGRFRVYRPDYPRAYTEGYALRAHVVWWINTGDVHNKSYDIHHKNLNRLDDIFENLDAVDHIEHGKVHNPKTAKIVREFLCSWCGKIFGVTREQLHKREVEGKLPKFCGQLCYKLNRKRSSNGAM